MSVAHRNRSAQELTRPTAEKLLADLVATPSLSGQEQAASSFLAAAMGNLGFDRAAVDQAGNAVGEMGAPDATRTVVLLGHIDTVPGNIPVRVEESPLGSVLYGRGSVDAKGPLATFTASVARLGSDWAHQHDVRLVVVGAVEEEAATSKGARFIRDRFNGSEEPIPDCCIIGEPSGTSRITLGYKGRILLEMEAAQPMAHTAGPDPGVGTAAVELWNWVADAAGRFNQGRDKTFDQLLPSLRNLHTWTDEAMQDRVRTKIGIRLPLDFAPDDFLAELWQWARQRSEDSGPVPAPPFVEGKDATPQRFHFGDHAFHMEFCTHGHEPAWRSDRNNPLVRSFLAAIREQTHQRPRFVSKSGTSDMNVVGPAWRCPIVAYGPGDSNLDHTPDEHIRLDEYWQAILVLQTALKRLAGSL